MSLQLVLALNFSPSSVVRTLNRMQFASRWACRKSFIDVLSLLKKL